MERDWVRPEHCSTQGYTDPECDLSQTPKESAGWRTSLCAPCMPTTPAILVSCTTLPNSSKDRRNRMCAPCLTTVAPFSKTRKGSETNGSSTWCKLFSGEMAGLGKLRGCAEQHAPRLRELGQLPPPSQDEIVDLIQRLPNRAIGSDQIPAFFLRAGGDISAHLATLALNKARSCVQTPLDFRGGHTQESFKNKGDSKERANSHTIAPRESPHLALETNVGLVALC